MSWQDELQHLDAELAAGRISAEEYRNKRDALSQAGATAPGAGSQGTGPSAQQEPSAQNQAATAQGASGADEATGDEPTVHHQQPVVPTDTQQVPAQQPPAQQPSQGQQAVGQQPTQAESTGDETTVQNRSPVPPPSDSASGSGADNDSGNTDPGPGGPLADQDTAVQNVGGQGTPSPGPGIPGTPAQGTPAQGPGTPSQGMAAQSQPQNPFPPAFSWNAASNQQPQPAQQPPSPEETTQVVPNVLAQTGSTPEPSDAEQTQTVNVNQIAQHQPSNQAPQNQFPHGQAPLKQPPQNQQGPLGQQLNPGAAQSPLGPQQQQVWPDMHGQGNQAWSSSSGTPWGESDLPPAPEQGEPSWMRQGPEVFETAGKKSGKGKLIGITLGVVVLVGALVTGVYMLFAFGLFASGGGEERPQANQPPKPVPTTSALPKPPSEKPTAPEKPADVLVPAPPGPKHAYTGPLKPKELTKSKGGLLPEPVRDFALKNGFVDGFFNGTTENPQTTLLAMKMPSEDDANGLTQEYLTAQEGLAVDENLSYQGVKVVSTGDGVFRTAYTTHEWTVVIEVNSSENAEDLFTEMLDGQLEQSPPTVLK